MAKGRQKARLDRFERARAAFRRGGGILRTSQALAAGIHPDTLYTLGDQGILERVSRGIYRLADSQPLGRPDLVLTALRVPKAVVCLISALAFHEITTQVPHEVQVALPAGAEEPRIEYPPLRTFRFAASAYEAGVEDHVLDGVLVRVYGAEKTIADCVKFRNRIGLDTVMEGLRLYLERRTVKVDDLMRYAAVCRVANVIRPYLEAML